jgi:hypothetical protein
LAGVALRATLRSVAVALLATLRSVAVAFAAPRFGAEARFARGLRAAGDSSDGA